MEEDITRMFGKIERIDAKRYLDARLLSTQLTIRVFDTRRREWLSTPRGFLFYGEVPAEYVGMEAIFNSYTQENEGFAQVLTSIEVGRIVPRNEETYDIHSADVPKTVPSRITGQKLNKVNGKVVFPLGEEF